MKGGRKMPVLHRLAIALFGFAVVMSLSACIKDSPTILKGNVVAAEGANPDDRGNALPVVVRYYELKTTKAFESAGFFDIYDEAPATLGEDMLGWGEIEMIPGDTKPIRVELNAETRFVGFVVAYRNIEDSAWRGKLPVRPQSVNSVNVDVGELEVVVKPG